MSECLFFFFFLEAGLVFLVAVNMKLHFKFYLIILEKAFLLEACSAVELRNVSRVSWSEIPKIGRIATAAPSTP